MSRLLFLGTSPRVAPGLLSAQAWEVLRSANRVLARDPVHPQALYIGAAGIPVEVLHEDTSGGEILDARQLAAVLLAAAREGTVVFLGGQDGEPELAPALSEQIAPLVEAGIAPEIEMLPGSWDLPGSRLLDLVAVMDRLRSPGGCPWDAQQTHTSLVTYLIEETYETLEVIEAGDIKGLREELGDLLLQVVFHSRLAEEHAEEPWSIDDVAGGVVDKLIRRHPHVFGPRAAGASDEELDDVPHGGVLSAERMEHLETQWQAAKTAEKSRDSVLDGVPLAQPALSLAAKMLSRVERGGLSVPKPRVADPSDAQTVVGRRLFDVVVQARRDGVDPEAALRAVMRDFAETVRTEERRLQAES